MKKLSLTLALAVISFANFAQFNRVILEKNNDDCSIETGRNIVNIPIVAGSEMKAPGDVFWSEDFTNVANGGDADAGWTYSDDAGVGGFVYIDADTIYSCASLAGGSDDPGTNMIGGSTPNGYLHLPIQFYNCTPGVFPREVIANPVNLDATVESPWIDLTSAPAGLVLEYKTLFILCCSAADTKLDINIGADTDGDNTVDTWTTLNGRDLGNGELNMNEWGGYNASYSIGGLVAGAAQMKIQFRMHGGAHYMWSIDDVQLVESLDNELSIVDYYAMNGGVYTSSVASFENFNTNYSEVPANIISQPAFGALVNQIGTNGENVMVNAKIDSAATFVFDSNSDAIANFGLEVTEDSVLIANEAWYSYEPTLTATDFNDMNAMEDGIPYTFIWEIVSDNADAVPDNNTQLYDYAQTWGRYSYHWQPSSDLAEADDDISPFSYETPQGAVGDIFCNTFTFEQEAGEEFKIYGLRVFIPQENNHVTFDAADNGVTFTPILHFYDETANAGDGGWVEIEDVTGAPYTVVKADTNDYVYLAFDETEVDDYTFVHGEYSVGIRIEEYNSQEIAVGVDKTYRQGDSHFLMKIDPWQDTWYYWGTGGSAMIDAYTRLDQFEEDQFVGVKKVSTKNDNVKVYPNPTTGTVKVENVENATINVYSLAGNLVKTVKSNAVNTSFDLTGLAKGTYLVKVVKEDEVITKKINLLK